MAMTRHCEPFLEDINIMTSCIKTRLFNVGCRKRLKDRRVQTDQLQSLNSLPYQVGCCLGPFCCIWKIHVDKCYQIASPLFFTNPIDSKAFEILRNCCVQIQSIEILWNPIVVGSISYWHDYHVADISGSGLRRRNEIPSRSCRSVSAVLVTGNTFWPQKKWDDLSMTSKWHFFCRLSLHVLPLYIIPNRFKCFVLFGFCFRNDMSTHLRISSLPLAANSGQLGLKNSFFRIHLNRNRWLYKPLQYLLDPFGYFWLSFMVAWHRINAIVLTTARLGPNTPTREVRPVSLFLSSRGYA